uniref:Thioredoxin domain-containing protein n=1 Tax=Zonotrichia albicollis TaxID=44394 RepID=A0A8D2MAN0_ZONAL
FFPPNPLRADPPSLRRSEGAGCRFSRRCGPCLRIAPAFNALSNKYPQATFLEVDVHQCQKYLF